MLAIALLLSVYLLASALLSLGKRAFGVISDPLLLIIKPLIISLLEVVSRDSPENDGRNDPRVFDVLEYGVAFGASLDWAWPTDQGKIIHSGRTLVLSDEEASLEWNWDSLFSYMKKSEGFNPLDKQQRSDGADYIPAYHGFIGSVQVAYAQGMYSGPAQPAFVEAIRNLSGIARFHARKEVILSPGTIAFPQLLQLSGIGDPSVLDPLGIDVRVNLPTVRRNFQTQTRNDVAHNTQPSFDAGGTGPDHAIVFLNLYELFSKGAGSNGSSQAVNVLNADALTAILGIQAESIVNHNAPVSVFSFLIGSSGSGVNNTLFGLLQFSRSNITITDTSVFTDPKVTVNWFDIDYDLDVQTAGARLGRRVLNNKALASIVTDEYSPGLNVVPDNGNGGTDDAWQSWIHDTFAAMYHEVGSTSMMRRDLGGVVDGKLRVYDTVNLRIVDAGVIPFQVSAHTSQTLCGVAEKAADITKLTRKLGYEDLMVYGFVIFTFPRM
ncbi:FAD-linked reductase, C-terminal domain-containing protein [Fomitiporia mediterranea MF3/22]|uniref:FAD-linked reductase, C-terminal domain-containing protein n=1 Tax=Fomitiporia mediterranea (strain MF3/22) TaxID=694068 RepID=UPI0004407BD2|nr:FAD-linked reductase, C-terminal domain-containing protein [Fomitiporia mediterranea MF3/22]EJC99473.1 FAD-linked reductase, C-terminal domain-containing protein [Fomitiporia mediterranea MF3/22]